MKVYSHALAQALNRRPNWLLRGFASGRLMVVWQTGTTKSLPVPLEDAFGLDRESHDHGSTD